MPIAFDHTTPRQRILFRANAAVDSAMVAVESLGATRILLIADHFTMALADAIASSVPVVARIHDIVQHVPIEHARSAVRTAESSHADAIISIGGGSATGLAKIVARDTGMPIIAIPTTFAGSEATDVWGQTEGERKTTGRDPRVLPAVVIYDVSLLAGLPAHLVTSSGLNAVAHAVDGFWAPTADPINAAMGSEALRALVPGLRRIAANSDDVDARELALYGAYFAGVAFSSAGSGLHHKLCHVLGGAYNLSHSELHAIVLPYVVRLNAPHAPEAADRVSAVFHGVPAAKALYDFKVELGIPEGLRDLGMPESGIGEAAAIALAAVPPANPAPIGLPELESLIRAAWSGEPIH